MVKIIILEFVRNPLFSVVFFFIIFTPNGSKLENKIINLVLMRKRLEMTTRKKFNKTFVKI